MHPSVLQKEITLSGHWSALAQLAQACDLSREEVLETAVKGGVWRKKPGKKAKLKRIRDPDAEAAAGDTLAINYNRSVLDQKPEQPVLVSDQVNYSIWYKKSGVLSQGSKWSDHCTITQTAAEIHGKKCLLVHRLDRAARGLIILAHTANACKALAAMFEAREVVKIYRAVVHGKFEHSMPYAIKTPIDGKSAHTVVLKSHFNGDLCHDDLGNNGLSNNDPGNSDPGGSDLSSSDTGVSELTIDIKTGRKHQIRNHLAMIGFPVVGDRLFDPERSHQTDLQLVAYELQFKCPFNGKHQKVQLEDKLLKEVQ